MALDGIQAVPLIVINDELELPIRTIPFGIVLALILDHAEGVGGALTSSSNVGANLDQALPPHHAANATTHKSDTHGKRARLPQDSHSRSTA